jgi:predicted Zn-dependent protease
MRRNNLESAIPLLRKAIQMKNDLRLAYVDLGAALMRQKEYSEAARMLQHAVELDPAEPDAHYRLARVYQAMGKTAESQVEFAKVRDLHQRAEESLVRKMSSSPPPLDQRQPQSPIPPQ